MDGIETQHVMEGAAELKVKVPGIEEEKVLALAASEISGPERCKLLEGDWDTLSTGNFGCESTHCSNLLKNFHRAEIFSHG